MANGVLSLLIMNIWGRVKKLLKEEKLIREKYHGKNTKPERLGTRIN
jgi:hypothetical protein